uniref:Uncharacterized protein n=1 Tax=Biomphalaria glabrata TaxID=6526 RepID=A0A2C9KNW2_BIOGL
MSEESGVWLSTSKPPKGFQQTLSKHNKAIFAKKRPPNKMVTTTFFSANLTQNSPPPTQLLTAKKQSCLTDYFGKGKKNKLENINTDCTANREVVSLSNTQAGCAANAHSYCSGENSDLPTSNNVDIDNSEAQLCKIPQSKPCVGGNAVECEIISQTFDNGGLKSPAKKFSHLEKYQYDLKTGVSSKYLHDKENIPIFYSEYSVGGYAEQKLTPGNSTNNHSTLQINEDINPNKSSATILKLIDGQNEELSNLNSDFITSFTDNILPSTCDHKTETLTFTEDGESLSFTDNMHSWCQKMNTQNEHLFHARKQQHYMDMGTLTFTEEITK